LPDGMIGFVSGYSFCGGIPSDNVPIPIQKKLQIAGRFQQSSEVVFKPFALPGQPLDHCRPLLPSPSPGEDGDQETFQNGQHQPRNPTGMACQRRD